MLIQLLSTASSGDLWAIIAEIAGAFAGAMFALISLAFAGFCGRLINRRRQHYDALVSLERLLIDVYTIAHDNALIIPDFVSTILRGNLYANTFHHLPLEKIHYSDLLDLDLLNALFTHNYDTRRFNDDFSTLNDRYLKLESWRMDQKIDAQSYEASIDVLVRNLNLLNPHLKQYMEDIINLQAKVRLRIKKDKPLISKISQWINARLQNDLTRSELDKEMEKLKQEIEATRIESRAIKDTVKSEI